MINQKGIVYWFTGLSGAGKTTLGKLLYTKLKIRYPNTVILDGDILREVYGFQRGYSLSKRKQIALCNARLCKLLSDQGIHVVCTTISMFHACREWNRKNITRYQEIYVRAPLNVLIARDKKNVYKTVSHKKNKQVIGLDLPAEEPKNPDFIIHNDGSNDPSIMIEKLLNELKIPEN